MISKIVVMAPRIPNAYQMGRVNINTYILTDSQILPNNYPLSNMITHLK